jgi:nicotinamide mononucleotide adenylyltransferase
MFEMARDWARINTNYTVVGAYLSPVGDAYKKKGLAPAVHRVKMCDLAVDGTSWLMTDTWEALQVRFADRTHLEYSENRADILRDWL